MSNTLTHDPFCSPPLGQVVYKLLGLLNRHKHAEQHDHNPRITALNNRMCLAVCSCVRMCTLRGKPARQSHFCKRGDSLQCQSVGDASFQDIPDA